METTQQTSFTDKIINGLKRAALELEEFRLQAALGKAEARDVYEGAKKIFNTYIHEAKIRLESDKGRSKEKTIQLKILLETLQVQLTLGKAESREIFEAQAKKISRVLSEVESLIKKNKVIDLHYAELLMEIEKFRIKLEILKLQYELKKIDAHEEFEAKKKDFLKNLSDIKASLLKKEKNLEDKWEHFRDEVSNVYSRLKKTFAK